MGAGARGRREYRDLRADHGIDAVVGATALCLCGLLLIATDQAGWPVGLFLAALGAVAGRFRFHAARVPRRYSCELTRRGLVEHLWFGWPRLHRWASIRMVLWEEYRVRVLTDDGEVSFDDRIEHWLELAARLQRVVSERNGQVAIVAPAARTNPLAAQAWPTGRVLTLALRPSRLYRLARVAPSWFRSQFDEETPEPRRILSVLVESPVAACYLLVVLLKAVINLDARLLWAIAAPAALVPLLTWLSAGHDTLVADDQGLHLHHRRQPTDYPWSSMRRVTRERDTIRVQTTVGDLRYDTPDTPMARELFSAITAACRQARRGRIEPAADDVPDTALSRATGDEADAERGISVSE